MNILLKKLTLINFKGIKSLSIDFKNSITSIFGANESGKTTVFDAFVFLFFGKDSFDRKDFNIKTLNADGSVQNKLEHEVSAVIEVDGAESTLKRVYKEKWVKKQGSKEVEMTGHETLYYWNEVPLQQKEFTAKVDAILKESIFKLITNPLYFNNLKWQDRRAVLFELAGEVTDAEIADGNADFEALLNQLTNKSLTEYKREIAARKKKLKDDLTAIPTRIDELNRTMPESHSWELLESVTRTLTADINSIDSLIEDRSKAFKEQQDGILAKQKQVFELTTKQNEIRFALESENRSKANAKTNLEKQLTDKIDWLKTDINSKSNLIKARKEAAERITHQLTELRERWNRVNEKELIFDPNDCHCPVCKQRYDVDRIAAKQEEMLTNFNQDKRIELDSITRSGQSLNKELEDCNTTIQSITATITSLNAELRKKEGELAALKQSETKETTFTPIEELLNTHPEYSSLNEQIKAIEAAMGEDVTLFLDDLKEQKAAKAIELDAVKGKLSQREVIEKCTNRIKELEKEEEQLAQLLTDLEATEFTINNFTKAKIDTIEQRINAKFKYVTFRMFEYTIEGNPVETCDTLYKGVPFSDVNTAGRIWAGMDIINTLSQHYGVNAPVFLDNRESVSAIPDTQSQIVNLIVSPADQQLRIA